MKLDDETRARLNRLSELKDRSAHWLMKRAVAEYLEREERYEREKADDLLRWQRFEETGECLSGDDMITWLDRLVTKADTKA